MNNSNKKRYIIGVDVGGSHLSAVVIDLVSEQILESSFITSKVDKNGSSAEILAVWSDALNQTLSKINPQQLIGIGFAMPGPFDYENGIARFTHEVAKYENLFGLNIGHELRVRMNLPQDIPFRFINDATAFALGEAWIGKSVNHKKSIAITLGTGFGSAFIENGRPVVERNDVPNQGCAWHLPFKSGIADDYFSTRWFIRRYLEETGMVLSGVKEIAEQAHLNGASTKIFEEFGANLAEFMAPWISRFDATCLVVGGNIIGAFDLWGPTLKANFKKQNIYIEITLSGLLETSAMIGAARLLEEEFWIQVNPPLRAKL